MDTDALLKKHGLATYGNEKEKKERAIRNGLISQVQTPVKETHKHIENDGFIAEPKAEPKQRGRKKGK